MQLRQKIILGFAVLAGGFFVPAHPASAVTLSEHLQSQIVSRLTNFPTVANWGGYVNGMGLVSNAWTVHCYSNYVPIFATNMPPRNAACWINSVSNYAAHSTGWDAKGPGWHFAPGTLITPRHVYFCGHNIGDAAPGGLVFTDPTNGVHIRHFIAWTNTHASGDVCVGVLDKSLPPSIEPMLFFPTNVNRYLPAGLMAPASGGYVRFQQDRFALAVVTVPGLNTIYTALPGVRGGDSGSPICYVYSNRLVMVASHGGFDRDNLRACINYCNTVAYTTNTISIVDLSAFPTFP